MPRKRATTIAEIVIKLEIKGHLNERLFDAYFAQFEASARVGVLEEFGPGYEVALTLAEGTVSAKIKLLTKAGAIVLGLQTFVVQAPEMEKGARYLTKATTEIAKKVDSMAHEVLDDVVAKFKHAPPHVEEFRFKLPASEAAEALVNGAISYRRSVRPPSTAATISSAVKAARRFLSDEDARLLLKGIGRISPKFTTLIRRNMETHVVASSKAPKAAGRERRLTRHRMRRTKRFFV